MKNVLVLAHDDPGGEARFQCALDLTRAVAGHLTCVDVTRLPELVSDYFTAAGGMVALVDEQVRELSNAARLKIRLEHEGLPWDWVDVTGAVAPSVIARAAFADLIVLSTRLKAAEGPAMDAIAANVALETRSLIVAVPEGAKRLYAAGPALVAWDGSAAATATLKAAVPLLAKSASVTLLTVGQIPRDRPVDEAALYLSRHDIHAKIENVADGLLPADHHIRDICRKAHAEYCVMGAFGHSPRLESWFGGVTTRMLAKSEIPLVIGH